MMISTRGRYALRVVTDLAAHNDGNFVPMKDIAKRQNLSLGYVARIIPLLSKGGIVEGSSGKGGGYRMFCPFTRRRKERPRCAAAFWHSSIRSIKISKYSSTGQMAVSSVRISVNSCFSVSSSTRLSVTE